MSNESAVNDTYEQLSSCMDPKSAFIEMMRAVFNQYTITTTVNGSKLQVTGYPNILCDIDDLYDKVFKNPIRASESGVLVLARKNEELQCSRLGLVIPKKVLKRAVWRNRVKRIARETFRLNQHSLQNYIVNVC